MFKKQSFSNMQKVSVVKTSSKLQSQKIPEGIPIRIQNSLFPQFETSEKPSFFITFLLSFSSVSQYWKKRFKLTKRFFFKPETFVTFKTVPFDHMKVISRRKVAQCRKNCRSFPQWLRKISSILQKSRTKKSKGASLRLGELFSCTD